LVQDSKKSCNLNQYHEKQYHKQVEEQENEEFPVVKSYAVVNPRTMMVHVKNTSVANRAMVASLWFKYMTNQAVSSLLVLFLS